MAAISSVSLIKQFFEADNGRRIEMNEFKALTPVERNEIADLCAVQLNMVKDAAGQWIPKA